MIISIVFKILQSKSARGVSCLPGLVGNCDILSDFIIAMIFVISVGDFFICCLWLGARSVLFLILADFGIGLGTTSKGVRKLLEELGIAN